MDATDVRILRTMIPQADGGGDGSPESLRPARLARVLGLSVDTVKARVARLEKEGVIVGYQVTPNLPILGFSSAAYFLRASSAGKLAARRGLERMGGLLTVHDYLGDGLCLDFASRTPEERERQLALLREAGGMEPQMFLELDSPAPPRAPTTLDWRIIRALRADPLASPATIGREVRVSQRTVKRRSALLVEEGTFYAMPRLDPSRASGLILTELLFRLDESRTTRARAAILRMFEAERICSYEPASPQLGTFDMLAYVRTPAEVELLRERASTIAGVTQVDALLLSRFEDTSTWVDKLIDEKVEEAPTKARQVPVSKVTNPTRDNPKTPSVHRRTAGSRGGVAHRK